MMVQFQYIRAWLNAQARTERGASLVEYALLVALIAVACIAAMQLPQGWHRHQVLRGGQRTQLAAREILPNTPGEGAPGAPSPRPGAGAAPL